MKAPVFQRITEEDVAELGDPGRKILQTLGELPDQFARALGRGLTLRENLRCQLHELEFIVPANTVTLTSATGSVTLARDASGGVVLGGSITPTATTNTTVPVATLPVGLRPASALTFPLQETAQEPFANFTAFGGGWVDDPSGGYSASFMRDGMGWTHTRGWLKNGTSGTAGVLYAPGYRPLGAGQQRWAGQAGGATTVYLTLDAVGNIFLTGGGTTQVDLSPVTFQSANPTHLTIGTDGTVSVVNPTRGTFSLAGVRFQSAPNSPPAPWAGGVHFASTLPKQATHLIAAGLRNVTDKVDVTSFTNPGWRNSTVDSEKHVQILDWPGLLEGKTYHAFLIAFAEDADGKRT